MVLRVHNDTYRNKLYIEEAPTSVTSCKDCIYLIAEGEVRVTFYRSQQTSYYFHLECFVPLTRVQIRPRDISSGIQRQMSPENCEKVKQWMEKWNRQFILTPQESSKHTQKHIASVPPVNRRVLLEAFKFLSPGTIVRNVTLVNHCWYHITWENELWQSFGPVRDRVEYTVEILHTCIHCMEKLKPKKRFMIDPLTNRPKCPSCYKEDEYRPQRFAWVKQIYGLTPAYLRAVKVPIFLFDDFECVYYYQMLRIVSAHQHSIAKRLLSDRNASVFGPECLLYLENLLLKPGIFDQKPKSKNPLIQKVFKFLASAKSEKSVKGFMSALALREADS